MHHQVSWEVGQARLVLDSCPQPGSWLISIRKLESILWKRIEHRSALA